MNYLLGKFRSLQKVFLLILAVCLMLVSSSSPVLAQFSSNDLKASSPHNPLPFYDPSSECSTEPAQTATAPVAGSLDQLLQAIALHESGGNPMSNSGNGAYGKYQFIPSTWQSAAQRYYPNAQKYTTANLAPESMQDAVEYLYFTPVFKSLEGDIFATAIFNYLPTYAAIAHANHNDPRLDYIPPHNGDLSVKKFGNQILDIISSGRASKIPLLYAAAPDFQTWLDKVGGPIAGTATPATTTAATPDQCCNTAAAGTGPVIVIDPGHASPPAGTPSIDPSSGLKVSDYANEPEMHDVFDVAQLVKAKLEKDGYKVVLTKNSVNEYKSLSDRAAIANQNNAALAISIHDQSGAGGLPFSNANNSVYEQQVGQFRHKGNSASQPAVTFTNSDVANKSAQYAQAFLQERSTAEGHLVSLWPPAKDLGRADLGPTNTWIVQLLSGVPWIYNEAGGNSAGQSSLNQQDKQKYADGLIGGVEKSIPVNGASGTTACSTGNNNGIVNTALNLAWPEPFSKATAAEKQQGRNSAVFPKPEYVTALQQYNTVGLGAAGHGADCGVFVATVMRASKADPNYPPIGTSNQEAYVRQHPEKYDIAESWTNTSELKPGDILIVNQGSGQDAAGHTYIYVGKQAGGYNAASASGTDRMPNLDGAVPSDHRGNFMRARLKG